MSDRQQKAVVNAGTGDQDFTVGTSDQNLLTNEDAVNVKTLKRCFNERIGSKTINIIDTFPDRIQNAILTAADIIIAPKIELVVRSVDAATDWDMASTRTESEREERVGITAPSESASEISNVLHVSNMNDETQNKILDQVSELSVQGTRSDWPSHTHQTSGNTSSTLPY